MTKELGVQDAVTDREKTGKLLALIPAAFATLDEAKRTIDRLKGEQMSKNKDAIVAEAVEALDFGESLGDDEWTKGFKRGVEHLAEALIGEGLLDWRKLQREAVKK